MQSKSQVCRLKTLQQGRTKRKRKLLCKGNAAQWGPTEAFSYKAAQLRLKLETVSVNAQVTAGNKQANNKER